MVSNKNRLWDDVLLILTMAVLAGCGLIYEYLLSHYAGRVLGIMESTIYAMIGLMIVAMGLGAFAARKIQCAFNGFVWLELIIAFLGSSSILIIGGLIALTQTFPEVLGTMFNLPPDAYPRGGLFKQLSFIAFNSPYFFGLILGFFIGMEIPLIARIREEIHQKHLKNNLGTIYGADYVGAGIGAAIWVMFLLAIDISQMSNLLYLDKVVYSDKTRYQQLTFTQRNMGANQGNIINFYLNGRLQFSSSDEFIYHSYLVSPVLAGSARHDNILIIGGGDGLALRDVLQWQPKKVTLVDLDTELLQIFENPHEKLPLDLADAIEALNAASLRDKRVKIISADAFIAIDQLLQNQQTFDAIIVDLPDPSHPDLNKLYSVNFYARLKQLLAGDGLIGIQSASPYHAKNAFIAIGKTVQAAGYSTVQQYHDNVPSFGEWGWTIANKMGAAPLTRLKALTELPIPHHWLTLPLVTNAFEFSQDFYQDSDKVPINYLGSHAIYQLHQQAWQDQQGLNNAHLQ